MEKFEVFLGEWIVKHRWLIILTSLLIILGVTSGARFLTFNNDSRLFFSKDNPQLKAFEAFENTYNKVESVFFIIAPKNGNVFTSKNLAAIEELTESSWQVPYSNRVDSITNFQYTRGEDDDLIVEDLVRNPKELSKAELEHIKEIAINEPLLANRLISPSGHVTGMLISVIKPGKSMNESPEIAQYVRNMVKNFITKYPDIDVHITGGIMINNAMGEATKRDLVNLVPIMYGLLFLILGLLLKSFSGTFATLIIIGSSMVMGLGMAGWIGMKLTPSSANAPTIILTLAMADSIHILITMFHYMREGKSKYQSIAESIKINFQPVFLTSATTAVGFLTMNFSDAPPFRDLGNIVSMGVTAAWFLSVFFLPALMAILPIRIKPKKKESDNSMEFLAEFIIKHRTPLFWGILVVITITTLGISKIQLNDNYVKYFDDSFAFRRATDFMENNLTGFNTIEYSLKSGESNGINDPDYLNTVEKFANWYRNQPHVAHVNVITDTIKRLNKNLHSDDKSYYRIPDNRELIAQYLLLYEMSLPFGLDLNNQISVDKSSTRMTVAFRHADSNFLIQMDKKARQWLSINAPKEMSTYGVGMAMMFAHISERNIDSMLGASFLALFIISFIIMLALRNLKLGFVMLMPNLTPAIMAFGVWGFFVGRVGLAISIIAALTLGIIVDDTVHFISKYLRARKEHDMDPYDAVRFSFATVGKALWVTTAVLVAGFSVLTFSGFQVNADVGLMTVITMIFALILDFLFLPILLIKVEELSNGKKTKQRNKIVNSNNDSTIAVPVTDHNASNNS